MSRSRLLYAHCRRQSLSCEGHPKETHTTLTSISAQTVSASRSNGGLAIAQAFNKSAKTLGPASRPVASIPTASERALARSRRRPCARMSFENKTPIGSSMVGLPSAPAARGVSGPFSKDSRAC